MVKNLIQPSGSLNQNELSEIALAGATKEVAIIGHREPSGEEIARRLSDEPVAGLAKTKAAQAVRTASN